MYNNTKYIEYVNWIYIIHYFGIQMNAINYVEPNKTNNINSNKY